MTSLPVRRPAPELPAGPRAALVVATGRYSDPALTQLDATANDAVEMAKVLADSDVGAFDVTSVVDRSAQEIRLAVEDFLEERHRGDLILVYLSCHGLLDRQDRLYFAAMDTRKDRLAATGVEAAWLWDRLEECRASGQIVILDCCNSGAFGRAGAKGDPDADLRLPQRFITQGRGRAVLTASRAYQRSWEGDRADGVRAPSVFTSALIEGLRTGDADADGDGYISVDEAYAYAYDKVVASGMGQVPQKWISAGEGTLLLARNPMGVTIVPTILSEDISAALDSRYPAIRVGAVNALRDWLIGPDPAKSLAAGRALQQIAATDVPVVAAAARTLIQAAITTQLSPSSDTQPAPEAKRPVRPGGLDLGPEQREPLDKRLAPKTIIENRTESGVIKIVTDDSFDLDVLQCGKPVVVEYWAEWCGPCRMVAPVLKEIATEYADKIDVVKLNIDENPVISQRYGIMAIPTLDVFSGGEVVKQIVGAKPKSALLRELSGYL
jgi:thioredoxin